MSSNKPEKSFRIGLVSASVFANTREAGEGGERVVRAVQLQRRYREDGGDWKTTQTFGLDTLPAAIEALRMAFHYVAEQEAIA